MIRARQEPRPTGGFTRSVAQQLRITLTKNMNGSVAVAPNNMLFRRRVASHAPTNPSPKELGRLNNQVNGPREFFPIGGFLHQLLPAGGSQLVELGFTIVVGDSPFRGDPPLSF